MIISRDSKFKYCAVLGAMFVLSSCKVTEGTSSTGAPETNQTAIVKVPKDLSTKQLFVKAIEHLEYGREQNAIVHLQAYMEKVPRSKNAKDLMEQIKTDTADYFPSESFSVNLESGESLSTLSRKYLGSALKFYALAKYNEIKNPSRVNVGQEIKIPLTDKAITVRAAEQAPPQTQQDVAVEQAETPATEVEEQASVTDVVVEEIENEMEVLPVEQPVAELPEQDSAETLVRNITSAIEQNDYQTALSHINELKEFGALTSESRHLAISALTGYAEELSSTDSVQASAKYAEAGELNMINGDAMAALDNFKTAAGLDPDNRMATENRNVLQKDIADKYHREASSAFRRQDLDVAIENWNKVLEIDPEHSSAQVYLAQAKELKVRLENLNN